LGLGNINKMMKQIQKMQKEMVRVQEELEARTVEASAGGGIVQAVVNGRSELLELKINPAVIDPEDVEMLQDLVIAAVNEGIRQAKEMAADEMQKVTGGLNLPGLPGLPF